MQEEQPKQNNDKKTNSTIIAFLTFIIGILVLIILSMNFTFAYKYKGNLEDDQPINLPKIENAINNINDLQNKVTSKEEKEENKEEMVERRVKNITYHCNDLVSFIQQVYSLRIRIEQAKDFESELKDLGSYHIENKDLNELFVQLNIYAEQNKPDAYFSEKFSFLIKNLYSEKSNANNFVNTLLKKVIFIRPIGDRALGKEGFDNNIVLVEKLLKTNNFSQANLVLDNISSNLNEFNKFKNELKAKVAIKQIMAEIDKILVMPLECNVVKKK